MKRIILAVAALMLIAPLPAISTDDEIKNHPGYIDLDGIEVPKTSESMTVVDLGPDLLRIFSKSHDDDPDEEPSRIMSIHLSLIHI